MSPARDKGCGHLFVHLSIDGRPVKRYIHRLVLEAFIGPCPPGMEGCHFPDPDRSNNRLSNLRWDTRKANCADTAAHGRAHRGESHKFAKLTESDVRMIAEIRREMPGVTYAELGILFGVIPDTIRAVVQGRNWSWLKVDFGVPEPTANPTFDMHGDAYEAPEA